MPSGLPKASCANAHVSFPVALVKMADSRWVFPVLYSICSPGELTIGRSRTYRTQFGLRTHAP